MNCGVKTLAAAVLLCACAWGTVALAQRTDAFGASRDHPAIDYTNGAVHDPVARLIARQQAGELQLRFDPETGYLRSVLDALGIGVESQLLVFSQTSAQAPRISQANPRAIYFNDTAAVGWVRGGEVLEIAAQDPRQGTIFYALAQSGASPPIFERDNSCLRCHLSWDTRAVPGPLVLTTYPRRSESEYADGGLVDHREVINHRWGGWYVTGAQVPRRHMGNRAMVRPDAQPPEQTPPAPAFKSLDGHVELRGYPTMFSDVVALMVLEHQAHLANLLTRVGWEARVAGGGVSSRMQEAVDELVDYMLFVDEAPLPGAVAGSSGFAEAFARQGPQDPEGRSLRDLDLNGRLMRYPLSYGIYAPAFDALPKDAAAAVYRGLWKVLSGERTGPAYQHLTLAKRQAIVAILRATKPSLPDYFGAVTR